MTDFTDQNKALQDIIRILDGLRSGDELKPLYEGNLWFEIGRATGIAKLAVRGDYRAIDQKDKVSA